MKKGLKEIRKRENLKKILLVSVIFAVLLLVYILRAGYIPAFILTIAAAYLIVFAVVTNVQKKNVKIDIRIKSGSDKDKTFKLHIGITNRSWLPCAFGEVHIGLENILLDETLKLKENINVGSRKNKILEVPIREKLCGAIEIRVEKTVFADPMGIFKRERKECSKATAYIWPNEREAGLNLDEIWSYNMESFKYSESQKGNDSSETFGINAYKPGDSIKAIHWKLSGKTGEIQVRELGYPVDSKVMILVDKKDLNHLSKKEKNDLTAIALSVSRQLTEMDIDHQVGWYNSSKDEYEHFRIKSQQDIAECIQKLLKSPFYQEGESGPMKFIEADIEKKFSKILFISNSDEDIERLMEYGEVGIYGTEKISGS